MSDFKVIDFQMLLKLLQLTLIIELYHIAESCLPSGILSSQQQCDPENCGVYEKSPKVNFGFDISHCPKKLDAATEGNQNNFFKFILLENAFVLSNSSSYHFHIFLAGETL